MTEMNFFFLLSYFFYSQRVLQLVYQELEMWEDTVHCRKTLINQLVELGCDKIEFKLIV